MTSAGAISYVALGLGRLLEKRVWLLGVVVAAVAMAATAESSALSLQRMQFLQARAALKAGDQTRYVALSQQLRGYALEPHLSYEALVRALARGEKVDAAVQRFLAANPDTRLSDKLQFKWWLHLAKQRRWPEYLQYYNGTGGVRYDCYALQARWALKQLPRFDSETLELWRKPHHHAACEQVFAALEKSSELAVRLVWERIFVAMEYGSIKLVKRLQVHFNEQDRQWITDWLAAHDKPGEARLNPRLKRDQPMARRILAHAMYRLAGRDPELANHQWQQIKNSYDFTSAQVGDIEQRIALVAAYRRLPIAHDLLHALPASQRTEKIRAWTVRTALVRQDWRAAERAMRYLVEAERAEPKWKYWQARVHEGLAKPQSAKAVYAELAKETNFFGFLAADQIGAPYTFRTDQLMVLPQVAQKIATRRALQMALEYRAVGMAADARAQWVYAIKDLSDDELKAATLIASQAGWHDRAIATIAKTDYRSDLTVRFPMPFEAPVHSEAQRYRLESALIYGVMRRESAYAVDIESSAGARGLMQLMPKTAEYVGKQLGRKIRAGDLVEAQTNIRLGSHYLREMMDKFGGNLVLATAAYNAGPHRVERWLPETQTMPADVWIENIPFTETRRYVRAVQAYTTIFDWRQDGRVVRLSSRMPDVPAKAALER